jgi:hypothetical protein
VRRIATRNIPWEQCLVLPTGTYPAVDGYSCEINNLQSAFRKELKKVTESKRSGAFADDVYAPKLWYFDTLLFTTKQEQPRKGIPGDTGIEDSDGEAEAEAEVSTQ